MALRLQNNADDARDIGEFQRPVVIGEALAQDLAQKIIFLELPPKARLTEEELCVKYNVSRSPVREAFRALEAEGLVQRLARRGVRVSEIGRDDAQNLYACRIVIEGLAAREAARSATDEDLARMHDLLDKMTTAMRQADIAAFFKSNVALTNAIHAAAANDILLRVAAGMEKLALRYRYFAHTRTHAMLDSSMSGHREVVNAIAARDPTAAEQLAQCGLTRSRDIILDVIDSYLASEEPNRPSPCV